VVEDCQVPESFYIPSTSNIHSETDLASIEAVTADASSFSEDVAQTNVGLVQGYKRIQNEL
jgi:hypothetical protein